jgi:hypothetical protein
MLDNSSLVKPEHKKWALCVRLIGSSGQVTEVTRVVFLAGVTGLPVVTMATASRQLSGAPTCKGRSDVAGKWEIRCQEIRFPRRELIFPRNVRSSARAHRNVRQLCPRPNSLNNIGLKGPARGAPGQAMVMFLLNLVTLATGVVRGPVLTARCGREDIPQGFCPVDVS